MKARIATALTLTALSFPAIAPAAAHAASDPTHITLPDGQVSGTTAKGITSWKGIPFAAPPVGPLRWRMPQPPQKWSGVLRADAYRNDCMQIPFGGDAAPLGTPPAEDCLYLNIWKPATSARKLPVIVWIYGGGFVNGGASPPTYAGDNLARQGVLFLSFNYRVSRFGSFAHPALTSADEDKGLRGDYGYMDQIRALEWTKRNIAAFGGDPANVTVIGESAGGMSVHNLLTSPRAHGLFKRVVIMSGGDLTRMGGQGDLASAEKVGTAFAESKGISGTDAAAVTALRALTADQVADGISFMSRGNFHAPFADGSISIPTEAAYKSGTFQHVPVMIGATSADIGGDTGPMIAGARRVATLLAGEKVPVYAYRFSYVAQSLAQPGKGAPHASDIPFFFDTQAIKYGAATTATDNAMGRTISAYIANYAKTGNPNGKDLPAWPLYRAAEDVIMDFAATGVARAVKDHLGGVR